MSERGEYETAMASLKSDTQVWQDEKAKHQTKLVDLKKAVNEASEELNLAKMSMMSMCPKRRMPRNGLKRSRTGLYKQRSK